MHLWIPTRCPTGRTYFRKKWIVPSTLSVPDTAYSQTPVVWLSDVRLSVRLWTNTLIAAGDQDGWHFPAFWTLTNEVDRIAVEKLVSAGMVEKNVNAFCDQADVSALWT